MDGPQFQCVGGVRIEPGLKEKKFSNSRTERPMEPWWGPQGHCTPHRPCICAGRGPEQTALGPRSCQEPARRALYPEKDEQSWPTSEKLTR